MTNPDKQPGSPSHGSGQAQPSSPETGASTKSFPLVTLLTDDVHASVDFYRGLVGARVASDKAGLVILEHGDHRFVLYKRDELARYLDLEVELSSEATHRLAPRVLLSLSVATAGEVAAFHRRARERGVTVIRAPHRTSWNRFAVFFLDPDSNVVEINSPIDS